MNKVTYKVSETTFSAFLTECEDEKQILLFMEHSKNTDSEDVTITEITEDGLRKTAIKMLEDNDELFDRLAFCCTSCICDVHLYPMESLDDYFGVDETLTEIINTLDTWFDTNDDFFYEEDGTLYSITDTVSLFKKHFSAEEVLDRAIEELDADLQMDDEFDEVFRALKKHSEQ